MGNHFTLATNSFKTQCLQNIICKIISPCSFLWNNGEVYIMRNFFLRMFLLIVFFCNAGICNKDELLIFLVRFNDNPILTDEQIETLYKDVKEIFSSSNWESFTKIRMLYENPQPGLGTTHKGLVINVEYEKIHQSYELEEQIINEIKKLESSSWDLMLHRRYALKDSKHKNTKNWKDLYPD